MRLPACWGVVFCLLFGATAFSQEQATEVGAEKELAGPAGIEEVNAVVDIAVASGAVVIEQNFTNNQVTQHDVSQVVMLDNSFNQAGGIISINQSAGNLDAQANVRLITIGDNLVGNPMITVVRGAVSAGNVVNDVGDGEARIQDSFNNTAGLVGINQSSGSLNQQANIALLSLGSLVGPQAISIGDTTLKDVNAHLENRVDNDDPTPRSSALTNSFQGFRGIAQIQQAVGDGNSTANVLGLSVSIMDSP